MANPSKPQFVVKLSVDGYTNFAKWITGADPNDSSRRIYQIPEAGPQSGRLSTLVSNKLDNDADLYEDCGSGPTRKWDKDQDSITVDRDDRTNKRYPMAVPEVICEDSAGDIDLDYLKSYVAGLCQLYNDGRQDDAAYALLGMYFLSRCR